MIKCLSFKKPIHNRWYLQLSCFSLFIAIFIFIISNNSFVFNFIFSEIMIIPLTHYSLYDLNFIEKNLVFICQFISFILSIHVINDFNNPQQIEIIYVGWFFTKGNENCLTFLYCLSYKSEHVVFLSSHLVKIKDPLK